MLYCFRSKRYAFLFDKQFLLCKTKGETFEIKEKLDLKKFKIDSEVPNSGKGKVCVSSKHSCQSSSSIIIINLYHQSLSSIFIINLYHQSLSSIFIINHHHHQSSSSIKINHHHHHLVLSSLFAPERGLGLTLGSVFACHLFKRGD